MFSFFSKHKLITGIVVLAVLAGGWYLFRPELLFVNQTVNEAPPFDATAQPLDTGLFTSNLHDTSGRATIYRQPGGGLILRITDFRTSNGPDVHVILALPNDPILKSASPGDVLTSIELGALKGNQGDQDYALTANTDLTRYGTVAIYCARFHVVFGSARLLPF
jgi:Electron transfer DM13